MFSDFSFLKLECIFRAQEVVRLRLRVLYNEVFGPRRLRIAQQNVRRLGTWLELKCTQRVCRRMCTYKGILRLRWKC